MILAAAAGLVMLGVILVVLRRTPYYLYVWIFLVVNFTGASGLLVWLIVALLTAKQYTPASGGEELDLALLLAIVAPYLFLCALVSLCVFPPRAVWERRAVIRAVTIAILALMALAIIQDQIVSARFPRLKKVELGQSAAESKRDARGVRTIFPAHRFLAGRNSSDPFFRPDALLGWSSSKEAEQRRGTVLVS